MPHFKTVMEPRYALGEAAKRFFPDGSISKDALKQQIRQGRLKAELVCGQYLVTESALLAMCQAGQRNAPEASTAHLVSEDTPQPVGDQHG